MGLERCGPGVGISRPCRRNAKLRSWAHCSNLHVHVRCCLQVSKMPAGSHPDGDNGAAGERHIHVCNSFPPIACPRAQERTPHTTTTPGPSCQHSRRERHRAPAVLLEQLRTWIMATQITTAPSAFHACTACSKSSLMPVCGTRAAAVQAVQAVQARDRDGQRSPNRVRAQADSQDPPHFNCATANGQPSPCIGATSCGGSLLSRC